MLLRHLAPQAQTQVWFFAPSKLCRSAVVNRWPRVLRSRGRVDKPFGHTALQSSLTGIDDSFLRGLRHLQL